MWACEELGWARDAGLIDSITAQSLTATVMAYRDGCGRMLDFDMIGVPLLYTQVRDYSVGPMVHAIRM